jgi:hypothetical protein
MKKTLAVALLFVVAACGGSSSGKAAPVSADRDKFVGTWVGNYGCPGLGDPLSDTLIIALGSGELDFSITIHSTFANPDTLSGSLTSASEINVPEQSMGGSTGTAKITSKGALLEFRATGLGITCGGADYARVP